MLDIHKVLICQYKFIHCLVNNSNNVHKLNKYPTLTSRLCKHVVYLQHNKKNNGHIVHHTCTLYKLYKLYKLYNVCTEDNYRFTAYNNNIMCTTTNYVIM